MNVIQLSAQLYDARDAIKRLLGAEKFAAKCAELAPTFDSIEKSGGNVLKVAIDAATAMQKDGLTENAVLLLAQAVEYVEPDSKGHDGHEDRH
jgi:hypothetical protein